MSRKPFPPAALFLGGKTSRSRIAIPALFLCMSIGVQAGHVTATLFVDPHATGPSHDGSTWCRAFLTLQDALAAATLNTIIMVAEGVYRPDRGGGQSSGNRSATFHLQTGVALLGGFAGCGEINPNAHDLVLHETVLSGDLSGDDGPGFSNYDENSYHVVNGSFVNSSAFLDGFTITGGNADGPDPDLRGGGLLINAGSPTIRHCTFRENKATLGGAMNCEGASPMVTDSIFVGNSAGFAGGAMRGWDSSPFVQNCLFVGNTAEAGGAAWYGASIPRFANCTFFANSADQGNALSFDSCCPQQPSTLLATNCIFWDGGDEFWNEDGSTLNVTQSDVQSGWEGQGNIDDDPLFVPGPGGCFYLSQTAAGQEVTSPCVDGGGDQAADLDMDVLTSRSDEAGDTGTVDMGYHFPITGRALMMGDLDRSLRIDLFDIAGFQRCFTGDEPTGVSPCCRIFDFAMDADVDLDDMFEFYLAITGP